MEVFALHRPHLSVARKPKPMKKGSLAWWCWNTPLPFSRYRSTRNAEFSDFSGCAAGIDQKEVRSPATPPNRRQERMPAKRSSGSRTSASEGTRRKEKGSWRCMRSRLWQASIVRNVGNRIESLPVPCFPVAFADRTKRQNAACRRPRFPMQHWLSECWQYRGPTQAMRRGRRPRSPAIHWGA